MSTKPLTPKQERFVIEYAKDLNATQAAIRAGYSGRCINRTASQLLDKTRAIIEERKSVVLANRKSLGIASLEQALKLCTALAFYDPRKLFDPHGNCTEVPELSRRDALMVAGFEIEELFDGKGESRKKIGYCRKYKLADRAQYVHMLMKHLGAFPTKPLPLGSGGGEPPRFDTSNWNEADWEAFKRLRQKSKVTVLNGQ